MKKLVVVIERSSTGYGIYFEDDISISSYGETVTEAKKNFKTAIKEYVEYCVEEGIKYNKQYSNKMEFEFKYDLQAFFKHYSFINISGFAKVIEMNASLLRQYKNGLAFASEKQRKIIENGIRKIGSELSSASL